ncbi:MAG: hypothetical protein LBI28_01085 [Treponema sp.]|jgi:hypothetical protein|nr:hypothetical protein [Treponema sp.]
MANSKEREEGDIKEKRNNRRGKQPVVWLLRAALAVSIISFIIYLIDADFSDNTLFILLKIVRYSSFLVCVCSFYKVIEGIYYLIIRPLSARSLKILQYLALIIVGLALIFLEALITAFSGGSV